MKANVGIRKVSVTAVIIRKDGTREDLGEISKRKNIIQTLKRRWLKWQM